MIDIGEISPVLLEFIQALGSLLSNWKTGSLSS